MTIEDLQAELEATKTQLAEANAEGAKAIEALKSAEAARDRYRNLYWEECDKRRSADVRAKIYESALNALSESINKVEFSKII